VAPPLEGLFKRISCVATAFALGSATFATASTARKPAPPSGELVLDLANPIVTAKIGDVPLRLMVGFEQKAVVELNPSAAKKLPVAFEPGFEADVGRTTLPGIAASAPMTIGGRTMPVLLSSHGRDCCETADGTISPLLLPYARLRFVRSGPPAALPELDFTMEESEERGLEVRQATRVAPIFVQFSLDRPDTVATSSGGAILAQAYGGHFEGGYVPTVAAFGIERPARTIVLDRPATLAGFHFDRLRTRIADFAGHYELPRDSAEQGDIVVSRRVAPQRAWPVILIGRDRLDRCTEIVFDTLTRRLTLRCAFESSATR
jgi:hypothetical protein